ATGVSKYQVGASEYAPETFDGVLDEVRIYPVALTPAQIQAAMNTSFCASVASVGTSNVSSVPLVGRRKARQDPLRRCRSRSDCPSSTSRGVRHSAVPAGTGSGSRDAD
ncbi:MAG: hypothetical protein ACHQ4J_12670, partial [Candidatus Binatia bacterium]